MKVGSRTGALLVVLLTLFQPVGLRASEVWTGVVLVADGQASGNWKLEGDTVPEGDQWERWEQMEKLSRPDALRRLAPPNAIMMPDVAGNSILAVAPHSGLEGYVVDAGAGVVDVRGAELRQCMVRLAGGGQLMVRDAFLSGFHVAESIGAAPGGTIVLENCAVTGSFGGAFWAGTQRWVVRGCHFKSSQLPWVNSRASRVPVVEGCHFENCYLPESFLARCVGCTFEGCVIGSPESFAAGGKPLALTEVGEPNRWLGTRAGASTPVITKGSAAVRFWSSWKTEGERAVLECRMATRWSVKPKELSPQAEEGTVEAQTEALRGRTYRRMDGGERLQFENLQVKVLDQGGVHGPGAVLSRKGRRVEWSQNVREFESENGFGNFTKVAGEVKRKGIFSPDFTQLVVVEEVPGSAPDLVRVFLEMPEGTAIARGLTKQVVGTSWRLEGAEGVLLRFETPTQLVWSRGAGTTRGSSQWRSLAADDELVIGDWQGQPARVRLGKGLRFLELVSNTKEVRGTFMSRDRAGDFQPLGAATGPKVVAQQAADPASPPKTDNPFLPAKTDTVPAQPTDLPAASSSGEALKMKTSRINGLLVAVLEGGKTAGATSQMNVSALPLGGSQPSSLAFNQKIGPLMEQALGEVRKFQTIRQGSWPAGYQIEISFADKYTPKDGPSAAVACALLMEGLFTGEVWDTALAVTGDLNADGSVQPVGGVPAKIKGAVGRKCRIVGIPLANERAVRDYFLSEGPHSVIPINIFLMKEFDHARDLAKMVKPAGLTTALAEFDKITQLAPPGPKAAPWLKQQVVANQLRKVLQAAPHHLSAKLLLEYAEGRSPSQLSLAGSIEAIERESYDVLEAIRSSKSGGNLSGIRKDKLGDAVFRLRRMRTQMHPGTRSLLDSMETFSSLIRTFLSNPPRTVMIHNKAVENIRAAGAIVDQQYQQLRNNPEVVAELMKE